MLPPALLLPTLTVRAPNRVTLSKALLARIGHFVQPALLARKGTKGGALGSAPPLRARTFELADPLPGHPGYYALRPLPRPNGSAQQIPPRPPPPPPPGHHL